MRLIIVSGSSGSGKSTVLQVLEDLNFHCIDNLPIALLPQLLEAAMQTGKAITQMAVSIDARNLTPNFSEVANYIGKQSKELSVQTSILYLDANPDILLKRFSASRRKHPLSDQNTSLSEAILGEKKLLSDLALLADFRIDTSTLNINELKSIIQSRMGTKENTEFSVLFESFSYRSGVPLDADYVFDVRCLPNPHWIPELRPFTGKDQNVQAFFDKSETVNAMIRQLFDFIDAWLPAYVENNRRYITIAIGCTGGQHRSVYIAEALAEAFRPQYKGLLVRHRELDKRP